MAEGFESAAEWAEQVGADEPHGLAEIEDHVMGRGERSLVNNLSSRGTSGREYLGIGAFLLILAGPVAAATAFWDRSEELRLSYSIDNSVAFPAVAIGSALGVVLVANSLLRWLRSDRRRDGELFWSSVAVAVCASLTLLQAQGESLRGSAPTWPYLLPAWIGLLGSVLSAGIGALAPARDRALHEAKKRRQGLVGAKVAARHRDIDDLHPAHLKVLLADRREALGILASRGLLNPGLSVDELARRPLGSLHSDEGG